MPLQLSVPSECHVPLQQWRPPSLPPPLLPARPPTRPPACPLFTVAVSVWFGSYFLDSIRFDSVRHGTVRFVSGRWFGSDFLGLVPSGSVSFGSIQCDSVRYSGGRRIRPAARNARAGAGTEPRYLLRSYQRLRQGGAVGQGVPNLGRDV